ncbi:hypothetical protein HYX10_06620 [Candidatus Woesearchaeota archaeon]|nr:hypothetical protein [Candidatus Woesearchaeota archaeon]
MEFVDSRTIKMDKLVNDLDRAVIEFVRVLEKHCDYVIISGYVAVLLGRSRSTEDVDIFLKHMGNYAFKKLFLDLAANGFECMQTGSPEEAYSGYLMRRIPIRFFKDSPVPNFEIKFAVKPLDLASFSDVLTVYLGEHKILISPLELQIAYKRLVLKSDKDIEDATHLEEACSKIIDSKKLKKYEDLILHYEKD